VNRSQEAEFEAFVAGGGRLLRTAYLLTGDHGHAEDLVQTALERTARRWTRLDGSPEAYARTVLAHAATDRWRRRRARVDEVFGAAPEPSNDDLAGAVVLRRSLIAALARLTPRQRALLVLRFFDDLGEAETAHTLGISVGAVKSGTSRALAQLRKLVPDDQTAEVST
jgi:RNA polymerase sigma-70 factor (sigma-E family)